jgi:molybdate transport repressor ModE-like protein
LKKVEEAFGLPLVDSQVGGGTNRRSTLTPAGRTLLKSFTRLQEAMRRTSDECAAELRRALRTGGE